MNAHTRALERLARANKLSDEQDEEQAHIEADDALCQLLIDLGYTDVIAEYDKVKKWYS